MPSLPDTAVIIFLGLLLFGPKGLAQIARQLGKLMGEFRRASNEFRMQMEEELRISEQADRQKQIAAVEAAAPVAPQLPSTPNETMALEPVAGAPLLSEPLPIATSGELSIMPPPTGLPEPRSASSSLSSLIDSVPKVEPDVDTTHNSNGNGANGAHKTPHLEADPAEDQRPQRYTTPEAANGVGHHTAPEETLHG